MVVIYIHHGNIGLTLVLLLEVQKEQLMFANLILLIVFITMVKEMLVLTCVQPIQNQTHLHAHIHVNLHTMLPIHQINTMEPVLIMLILMLLQFKLKL